MNKTITTILMLLSLTVAKAEDILQVTPFSTSVGVVEDDWESFSVEMNNTKAYTALQFDMYLPDGMTLINDGPLELNEDRFPGYVRRGVFYPEHDYECTKMGDGHYFITVYHTDFAPIEGESGEIMRFYYETAKEMKPGYYPIKVTGTVLGVSVHEGTRPEPSVSYVKIGNPEKNVIYNLGSDVVVPSFVNSSLSSVNNIVVNGVCQNLVLADGYDFYSPVSFTGVEASYDATVSASLGYKTLVLPFDWDVPVGFEAYETDVIDGTTLTMNKVSAVSANKPVILKNVGTAMISASNVAIEATTDASLEDCALVGTYSRVDAPVGAYVLQNHDGEVAFYRVTEAVQPAVGAFRAYVQAPANNAKTLNVLFNNGEATGTNSVQEMMQPYAVDYMNAAGIKITNKQGGIKLVRMSDGSVHKTMLTK